MSNDILFLAEFAGGTPARSALELATGAAELAAQSGGSAVGAGVRRRARPTAPPRSARHGAARAIVLGDEDRPAITYAPAAVAAAARRRRSRVLAPATPNGRDLAAALVGSLHLPAFGPVRAARIADGVPRDRAGHAPGQRDHHLAPGRRRADAIGRAGAGQHLHAVRGAGPAAPR